MRDFKEYLKKERIRTLQRKHVSKSELNGKRSFITTKSLKTTTMGILLSTLQKEFNAC